MELRKEFEFNDIAYHDAVYGVEILLDGAVKYCVCAEDGADIGGAGEEILGALAVAFQRLGNERVPYNAIAYDPDSFAEIMNSLLKDVWNGRGLALKEMYFTALYPDESSIKSLIAAKKNTNNISAAAAGGFQKIVCPSCGAVFSGNSDMKFCAECGAKLTVGKARDPVEEYILENFSYIEKIEAVKYYKQATGADTEEAREAVGRLFEKDKSGMTFMETFNSVDAAPSERLESFAKGLGLNDSFKDGLKNLGSFLDNLTGKGGVK